MTHPRTPGHISDHLLVEVWEAMVNNNALNSRNLDDILSHLLQLNTPSASVLYTGLRSHIAKSLVAETILSAILELESPSVFETTAISVSIAE
jgi:hypothetical protein